MNEAVYKWWMWTSMINPGECGSCDCFYCMLIMEIWNISPILDPSVLMIWRNWEPKQNPDGKKKSFVSTTSTSCWRMAENLNYWKCSFYIYFQNETPRHLKWGLNCGFSQIFFQLEKQSRNTFQMVTTDQILLMFVKIWCIYTSPHKIFMMIKAGLIISHKRMPLISNNVPEHKQNHPTRVHNQKKKDKSVPVRASCG